MNNSHDGFSLNSHTHHGSNVLDKILWKDKQQKLFQKRCTPLKLRPTCEFLGSIERVDPYGDVAGLDCRIVANIEQVKVFQGVFEIWDLDFVTALRLLFGYYSYLRKGVSQSVEHRAVRSVVRRGDRIVYTWFVIPGWRFTRLVTTELSALLPSLVFPLEATFRLWISLWTATTSRPPISAAFIAPINSAFIDITSRLSMLEYDGPRWE